METLLREIDKLTAVRTLGLPAGLSADASEKLAEAWRARAARSYPSDLRVAPRPVRLSLLAALCWGAGRRDHRRPLDLLIRSLSSTRLRDSLELPPNRGRMVSAHGGMGGRLGAQVGKPDQLEESRRCGSTKATNAAKGRKRSIRIPGKNYLGTIDFPFLVTFGDPTATLLEWPGRTDK